MKKLSRTLAAAGLAVGLALTGSVAANAITFGGLSCANSVNGHYFGIGGQASGTTTMTIVNGPSAWGHTYAYTSTIKTRNGAAPTSYSSASYFTTTGGTYGWVANGCYRLYGWAL